MVFLKNKRAWTKWIVNQGMDNQDPEPRKPKKFPCFAYATVQSFGFEELKENYLYLDDVNNMLVMLLRN
jgi:hypothetical protein